MSGLKTKASYRLFWQSYISLRGRRRQGCHAWGEGGKDVNFTQGRVGEDPRKEVGKKSPTWQVYVKEGERRREKRSLLSPPNPPAPHSFRRLQGRLDKRRDVWKGRKGIRLPFPFWRFFSPSSSLSFASHAGYVFGQTAVKLSSCNFLQETSLEKHQFNWSLQ